MPEMSPNLAEIEGRIAVLRENIRELVEQAAAFSGAADEELVSQRIAKQEAQLELLTRQRDEPFNKIVTVVPDLVVLAQSGHAAKTDITRYPGNVRFDSRHCKSKTSCLLLTQSGHRLSSALKGFPPHWLSRWRLCRMKFHFIRTSWEGKFPVFISAFGVYLR